MRRFVLIQLLSFLFICFFCISDVMAIGLGFTPFTHFSSGDLDWKIDYDDSGYIWGSGDYTYEFDDDSRHQGFEFVLDTAVARNTVFNYRLNLGYEKFESKDMDLEMDSITVDNTFGFAVLRTKVIRLWLGPQLRFSYSHDDDSDDLEIDLLGFGIGPVIGVNLNFSELVTPSFTVGYRVTKYEGTGKDTYWYEEDEYDISIDEKSFFFNFCILFRINDMF